jgi:hypothetical protein
MLQRHFSQVVLLLAGEGILKLKEVYTDGTKIESAAGRYTFVCGSAIKTNKKKMADQLEAMWYYAQNIADEDEEDRDPEPLDFKEIDPEKIKQTAAKINAILKGNDNASSKAKAKARNIEKTFPPI